MIGSHTSECYYPDLLHNIMFIEFFICTFQVYSMQANILVYPEKLEISLLDDAETKPLIRVASDCMAAYDTEPYSLVIAEPRVIPARRKRSIDTEIRCFEWKDLVSPSSPTFFPFLVPGEEDMVFDSRFYGSKLQIRLIGHHLQTNKQEFKWYGMSRLSIFGRLVLLDCI